MSTSAWRSAAEVGGVGVLLELGFERGGAVVRGGLGVGGVFSGLLSFLELRLELGDPLIELLLGAGGRRPGLFEFGRELLGPVAVLGGFGG